MNRSGLNPWVIVVVGLLFFLTIGKDWMIKMAVTTVGADIVGAPIEIKHFSLNLFTQKMRVKDLKLYNPQGFERRPLLDLADIDVDYDLGSLFSGKPHFEYVNVNVRETVLVKNQQGKLNVDALKVAHPKEQGPMKDMPLLIDELKLNLDRTVFIDYSHGKPVTQVFDVGLRNKSFKNIKTASQLASVIIVQGMGPAAVKGAAFYAATAALGVGFLPAGAVAMLVSKDHVDEYFKHNVEQVFAASESLMKEVGETVSADKASGSLKGKIDGADVTVKVEQVNNQTQVTVSCRKMMLPKVEIASGFMYQLKEKIK